MNGHRACQHYLALKKYYTSDKYDVFKNPRVEISESTFLKRNDKFLWNKLARQMASSVLLDYMVANFAYGNTNFLYNQEAAESSHIKWVGRKQGMNYFLGIEVSAFFDGDLSKEKLLSSENSKIPALLNRFMGGHTSIETVCALETIWSFTDDWSKNSSIVFEEPIRQIMKTKKFIKFDRDRLIKMLEDLK